MKKSLDLTKSYVGGAFIFLNKHHTEKQKQ
jgi:hypothetical protein